MLTRRRLLLSTALVRPALLVPSSAAVYGLVPLLDTAGRVAWGNPQVMAALRLALQTGPNP